MKQIRLIILFLFWSILAIGQQNQDTTKFNNNLNTEKSKQIGINLPDTLHIKNISDKTDNLSFWDKNLPWIIALLIGIISALINLFIAYRLRQSNDRNIQRQIDGSKDITLIQFKSTIASKNRQEWINELRHATSELISESIQITYEMIANKEQHNKENIKKHLQILVYNKAKIEMLLNDSKPEQKKLIENINVVFKECISAEDVNKFDADRLAEANKQTIEAARHLFGIHWEKIKVLK